MGRSLLAEPSVAEVHRQLASLHARGARKVMLMGGEALLRRDLPALLRHARTLGLGPLGVATNGCALAPEGTLERLIDAGLELVELSIHGHTPELANAIAGTRFTFERQARTLAQLQRLGELRVTVNTVICRSNVAVLAEVARYVLSVCPRADAFKLKLAAARGRALAPRDESAELLGYDEVALEPVAALLTAAGKPFWFEGFPLCRLGAHAHRSHELHLLARDERYFDFDHDGQYPEARDGYFDSGRQLQSRRWPAPSCSPCPLRPICGGVDLGLVHELGLPELATAERAPEPLLAQALASHGLDPALARTRLAQLRGEARPAEIDHSAPLLPSLRFEHPAEPEPVELWIERIRPGAPAYARSARFALSYRATSGGGPSTRPALRELLAHASELLRAADERGASLAAARQAVGRLRRGGWSGPTPAQEPSA